ncbi:MAG: phosphate acyltransferase PlsX [Gammaproteobacteria bacterium]|nr:phosphate acyltransferase PlsX [Gammaproteobacteria bacterium]MCW8840498.1 phosphate acyltransferase PlsX [Gammaproteobacteria bacterium]MCW8927750.1 phosphate acyltransferase PlsX [Gammaproteobacteria bacterium]MCW8958234.1 phosphate acyltransferase PlsX [Gammaproteobacteria bacterium]MCW8973385.1 phosphate acyltransferase PlsX [Gammaproteobacteria bacterium]
MTQTVIAIDAMGGDHGPGVTVPASLLALKQYPNLKVILVGDEEQLKAELSRHGGDPSERLIVQHASQVVAMDEAPSSALRGKKDSSMRVAINLVKQGDAQACVSAGNTGALMATARFVLKTLDGIDRPALITALPTMTGHSHMLDLGANVDSSAEVLYQFAVMGSVLASAVDNNVSPSVGLLNVGEEEIKGNEQVKQAHKMLSGNGLNYVGYVEGDDIFKGTVDVVVADGFVGNVALKTSEGVGKMISYYMKQEFKRNILTRLAGLVALPVLRAFRRRIDPRAYNGASLVGLRGIVIKSHGSADAFSYSNAIKEAMLEVEKNVPGKIQQQLGSLL